MPSRVEMLPAATLRDDDFQRDDLDLADQLFAHVFRRRTKWVGDADLREPLHKVFADPVVSARLCR